MNHEYSTDLVNLDGINKEQMELIKKLNTSLKLGLADPQESIMHYGQLCTHDDGFLCQHRLQFIVDWLKNKK